MRRVTRWAVLALVMLGIAGALWLRGALVTPYRQGETWRLVTVSQGMSLRGLAGTLHGEGLLSPAGQQSFVFAGIITRKGKRLKPGRYRLSPAMSPWEMLGMVEAGKVYTFRVTIPEGFTLRQIAALLAEKGAGSEQEFLDSAQEPGSVATPFPMPQPTLEGYLFPDTYDITGTESAGATLERMVRRFTEVVWEGVFRGEPTSGGLTLHQAVTLASLIEGEARVPAERSIIASVLRNRLSKGMRLECDATVQYALGERRSRLLHSDLEIESPYNTYRHAGLPPGPICSPGRASIEAAIRPATTPYLFYVARGDGSHVFTRTFDEHRAAISRIRDGR